MRKRFFAICSVLIAAIVLVAMVPGCDGVPTTGTIEVHATLNGAPWAGAVEYTLAGPGAAAPTIINGSSVSNNHTGEAGVWSCAYVSGGPGVFVDITPPSPQTLAAGGTIGFTLNFETPPPPPDASIEFSTWTINGDPVSPGPINAVGPGDWIDIEYKEHVSGGQEGEVVTVHQTSWLLVHYQGPFGGDLLVTFDPVWLHVVNAPGAVSMDPPAEGKSNQQATVEGHPVNPCDEIELPYCEPVALDVEVDWELKICTNYTKTINWIGFGGAGPMTMVLNGPLAEVLFEVSLLPVLDPCFSLTSMACVNVEGDENPANNCTDWCPPLDICYQSLLP